MKSASILVLLTIWLLPPTIVSAQYDDLFIGKRFEKIKEISFTDSSSKVSKPSLLMKFYLNDQGYVFRGESFSDEKVVSWSEYRYSPDGKLLLQKNVNPYYASDKKGNLKEILSAEWFTLLKYEYQSDGKLKKILSIDHHDSHRDTTITHHDYDSLGRLTQTRTTYAQGTIIRFKSNSTEIDTAYQQDGSNMAIKPFTYHGDTLSEVFSQSPEPLIRKLTIKQVGKTVEMMVDSLELPITTKTTFFNKQGNAVRVMFTIQAPEKITWDEGMEYDLRLLYNAKGWLISTAYSERGKLIRRVNVIYK
jgi:hypothetical protein